MVKLSMSYLNYIFKPYASFKFFLLCSAFLVTVISGCEQVEVDLRSNQQFVLKGKKLFRDNCVQCHNVAGVGDTAWRQRDKDGHWPAPPLNGTGHSWHHSQSWLANIISEGSPKGKGKMPAWKTKFDKQQIKSLVAYIHFLWPDSIYQRSQKMLK